MEMEEGRSRTSKQRPQPPNPRPAAAMGDAGEARALRLVAVARRWLEDPRVGYDGGVGAGAAGGSQAQALSCVALAGARVSVAEPGRVVCSLRVGAPVTDSEGRWHAGAVAAAVDCVCSALVYTVEGAPTATVSYSMSYFSPADRDTEVEVEGRVVSRKGKLTAAVVDVRKKESGELVAVGRQWVTPAWPTKANKTSKL